MRGVSTDIDLVSVAITLFVIGVVVFLGFQIMSVDFQDPHQTEHYNQSEEWCNSQNGSLYLANDASMAEHNGFHCNANGQVYHMHRVADLNYTEDIERVESNCGTTHSNTPLFVGCNLSQYLIPAILITAIVVVFVLLLGYLRD